MIKYFNIALCFLCLVLTMIACSSQQNDSHISKIGTNKTLIIPNEFINTFNKGQLSSYNVFLLSMGNVLHVCWLL